jgi:hypothetical protein
MISGKRFWLWRAVDTKGEVLDLLLQRRRNKAAAINLMRKLLKKQGFAPELLVTDELGSYGAGKSELTPNTVHGAGTARMSQVLEIIGAPERLRTSDPQIRSLELIYAAAWNSNFKGPRVPVTASNCEIKSRTRVDCKFRWLRPPAPTPTCDGRKF